MGYGFNLSVDSKTKDTESHPLRAGGLIQLNSNESVSIVHSNDIRRPLGIGDVPRF